MLVRSPRESRGGAQPKVTEGVAAHRDPDLGGRTAALAFALSGHNDLGARRPCEFYLHVPDFDLFWLSVLHHDIAIRTSRQAQPEGESEVHSEPRGEESLDDVPRYLITGSAGE